MEKVTLFVNNVKYELLVKEDETLSKTIRERLNLTGTKIACEQGSCGACTVWLEDKPVLSCITPTLRCDNKRITTIEGIGQNHDLHPLQKKFIEKGAIQCGFCTPGMVMTALNFVNKNQNCTIDDIKEALSGNLCRCTGYKKIIEAVSEYALGLNKIRKKSNKIIGTAMPYIESEKKVKGIAEYTDDIRMKNVLYCKFLRSPYAHAIIEDIDISDALKCKGVVYIATGKEIPEKFGVLPISQDETAMAVDKVRFAGEIVAAVAAESEEEAKFACKKIKVKYKALKTFFTIDDSLKEIQNDEKIHSHCRYNNNIHKIAEIRFGNQEKGFKESDIISEMTVDFEGLNHVFTEPHASIAYYDENGLTIITSTQVPHYLHRALSKVLKLPLNKIRVIKPYIGGGFGGKSDPFAHEIIVAYIAIKTKRPVRVRLSREEVFLTNHGRHPSKITLKVGADKEGNLKVLDGNIFIDGGAYASFGVVTTYYNGSLLQGPYKLEHFGYKSTRVYTNKPQCGAMRGHGGVNARFVMECIIDDIARKLKMDPCELRLKNFLPSYTKTIGEFRITSNGIRESLQKVMAQSDWKNKFGKLPYGHGIGVACSWYISGSLLPIIWNEYPQSVVHLKLDFDGRVLINSGASDIGQGTDTVLSMIVAEELGIDINKTAIITADTLLSPVDLGSYSSRVTFMAGNAAKAAAEKLKNEILTAVSKRKEIKKENIFIKNSTIIDNKGKKVCNWLEAVDITLANRGAISISGWYISPKLGGKYKGAGAGLSPSYSFGAVIAEVKVNPDTGYYKIINIWGAHDCGKALNPLAVEGQLEGSWHMGIGQAFSEEMKYYNGLLLNANLLDYKIPTTMDIPEIHTNIIESIDPEGPFGAKECGEGALHPTVPAVANAIYDAIGIRIKSVPITYEKIYNAIKKLNK